MSLHLSHYEWHWSSGDGAQRRVGPGRFLFYHVEEY